MTASSRPLEQSRVTEEIAESQTDYRYFSIFRVIFALCMVSYATSKWYSGYVKWTLLAPKFHFTYSGFSWVRPLPEPYMSGVFFFLALSSLIFASGFFYRASALCMLVLYTYTILIDKVNYNNHYYLVIVLCFYFVLSKATGKKGACWALDLFRYQFALTYFFAGLAKWNRDWLLAEPLEMWLSPRAQNYGMPLLGEPSVIAAMCIGGLLLDLLVGPALLYSRTRLPALFCLAGFHLSNEFLFDIGVFPALMLGSLILFLGPPSRPLITTWRTSMASRMALFVLVLQLLIPLRHYFIDGPVAWTEDGHRYAWRMKLRNKRSELSQVLVDGKPVEPAQFLDPSQLQKVGGRPDLLHDFAQYLSSQHAGASVRIASTASLNGRPWQSFVTLETDLSKAPLPMLARTPWVEELQTPFLSKSPKWTIRASLGYLYLFVSLGLLASWFHFREILSKVQFASWMGSGILLLGLLYQCILNPSQIWLGLMAVSLITRLLVGFKLTQGHWLITSLALLCLTTLSLTASIIWLYGPVAL